MGWLLSGFNSLIAIGLAMAIAFGGGVYAGHKYEKNYYEARIAKDKEAYQEALAQDKAKYDLAASDYFQQVKKEQVKNVGYQKQVRGAAYTKDIDAWNAKFGSPVSYGFIRLYNASATGETTNPANTDNLSSPVDLATVLTTTIENHGKYREVAAQIEALKSANTK
jgi:hypothetical protein